MFDIGRVCVKLAGRDAGKHCVIVDVIDTHFVLVDGETRRRKVSKTHLLPLEKTVHLSKGASHDVVSTSLSALGLTVRSTKPKKAAPRPKPVRKGKQTRVVKKSPASSASGKATIDVAAKSHSKSGSSESGAKPVKKSA